MIIVKLRNRHASDDDIWLDDYKLTDKGIDGWYTTKTGKILKYVIPNENIAVISDVGDRNSDWNVK